MNKKKNLLIAALLFSHAAIAQNSNVNTPAAGIASSDAFTYGGHTVSHYGLGWYNDSLNATPMAYFSAYGGLKFFTQGQSRAVLDGDGKFGVGTLTPGASLHVVGGGAVIGNSALVNNTEGALSIGNIYHSFSPTASNWSGSGSNLILSAQDYSSIAFHHYGNRVDFIRAGAGTIQLGYDGGWGMANIGMPNGIWNSAGNVGVGTLSPGAALTIYKPTPSIELFDSNFNPGNGSLFGKLSFGSATAQWASIEAARSPGAADDISSLLFRTSYSPNAGGDGLNMERMRITPDGHIGIGTATPGQMLDVNGNIRLNQTSSLFFDNLNGSKIQQSNSGGFDFFASNAAGNGNITINPSSSGALYLNYAAGNDILFCNGSYGLTGKVTNNGDMGIGTLSVNPSARLTLGGGGQDNPLFNPGADKDYKGLGSVFRGEYPQDGSAYNLGSVKMVQRSGTYHDAGDMVFSTAYGAISEKMRITGTGYVGIGTTNPGDQLTVQDRVRVSTSNGQGGYYASDASTGGSSIFSLTRQGNDLALCAYDGIGFTSAARSGPTNAYNMFINTDGNVGIGTATPHGYKLAVNGSIHTKAVVVDLNGFPDYVFNLGYKLRSLAEVKSYIDQNHHLPEMPSEKEVSANGLNLGEINKLLTKKVEELTLYLIEKDHQQKELEEKFRRLEEKMNRLIVDK